ncbi:stage III sporulation protein AF [Schnuerera sp. xch1]|uniref:stage III sporulation protein AF n=1 Tax=Schnuerera sp. xch1 TaxID=2874283 RepID=UPI001CBFE02D|nr:stage III sporulation protein AF [Schnuerera sp. xch1]MBZ2173747.1 stage III sporulation protein AF [Schnuerera sp. xch1]
MKIVEFLRNWVKDIAIIFVLVSIIEIVVPNNNLKKYVNMVIGFLIIIAIISPFVNLINENYSFDKEVFKEIVNGIEVQNDSNLNLTSMQEKQIKDVYMEKVKEDIKNEISESSDYEVKNIYISIYEDEENYGNIKEIELILEDDIKEKEQQDTINVIKIEEIKMRSTQLDTMELEEFEEDEEVKNIISEKYNVSKENIRVFLNTEGEGEVDG